MNFALIFAGGTGRRMKSNGTPKQFLDVFGKPIIIHTLNNFERHAQIEKIVVVCLPTYIQELENLLEKFAIKKVLHIVSGGSTGQESIYNGLQYLVAKSRNPKKDIVLINDGVRPLLSESLISLNIETAERFGSCITSAPAIETVCMKKNESEIMNILPRENCLVAKAPQTFFLSEIYDAHLWAKKYDICDAIDSADLMMRFGKKLHYVLGPATNIKITYPEDYYIFQGILQFIQNEEVLGL